MRANSHTQTHTRTQTHGERAISPERLSSRSEIYTRNVFPMRGELKGSFERFKAEVLRSSLPKTSGILEIVEVWTVDEPEAESRQRDVKSQLKLH